MHRVAYADTVFLTDGKVAEALLAYARVLAVVGQADVVVIPGLDGQGVARDFELIVGPSSQIISFEVEHAQVAIEYGDVLRDLEDRTATRLPQLGPGDFLDPDMYPPAGHEADSGPAT